MKTASDPSKTRYARRVRAVRIAWAETVKEEVQDHVGDSRHTPGIVRLVLRRLVADFGAVESIEESDVEDAVASACADCAGAPGWSGWDDDLLLRPDFESRLEERER